MVDWNLDQVGQWLIENGFGKYYKRFRDEDIDGLALTELQDKEIFQLLTLIDSNGIQRIPSERIQKHFRIKLEQLKNSKEKQRRMSGTTINPTDQRSKTLMIKSNDLKLKFFQNSLISNSLIKYFSKKFHIQLNIPLIIYPAMKDEFSIELIGSKETLLHAFEHIQLLFSTVKFHIFNDENLDQKFLKYSVKLYSNSALSVLERIFLEKNKLTIWEKTSVLSGFFRVFYLHGDKQFQTSVEFLRQTLNQEIMMIKDLTLPNVSSTSKQCQEEFNEFLRMKLNQSTITIISFPYSFQTQVQITFFGLKSSVRMAKNQVRTLIDKHQMKTVRLNLDSTQRQFLLDNCQEKLRKFELDHQLSNVKISIRQNSFVAPKFLIRTIQNFISSMIYYTITLNYEFIPDALKMTETIQNQLKSLAQSFHCQLKKIHLETKNQVLFLPQKSSGKKSSSEFLQRESHRFLLLISPRKSIPIASNFIEIQRLSDEKFDLEIISTIEDAQKEQIDSTSDDLHLESNEGKRILFVHWLPPSKLDDLHSIVSIERFFSLTLHQIVENYSDTVKTIRYLTTGWEKSPCRQEFLHQLMKLLEKKIFANRSWRIFFICDQNQNDLFEDFIRISPSSNNDEFLHPISKLTITIEGTDKKQIDRCENKINDYIEENLLRRSRIDHPFDGDYWNQSMINVFYQFCFDQYVLPRFSIDLELIGTIKAIEKVKEKYQLMLRVNQLRLPSLSKKQKSKRFNILLSCSSYDGQYSSELANRLIDENYLVAIDFSDEKKSSISSNIDRSDVILICFSWNYFINVRCKIALELIKSSKKKFIPIIFSSSQEENIWTKTMELEEGFYEIFEKEIRFRFNDNFDPLLCELLRYTKPGAVEQIYPLEDFIFNEPHAHNEIFAKDEKPKLEINIEEKQRVYDLYVEKVYEKQKLPSDELNEVIKSLQTVLEDYPNGKYIRLRESPEEMTEDEETIDYSQNTEDNLYFESFLDQIQRWIDKTLNKPIIKGNFNPFTLTGDFNDAIFPTYSPNKIPWWENVKIIDPFDHHLETENDTIFVGSWFNAYESHEYFEQTINRDRLFREISQHVEENDENKQIFGSYVRFNTYIKKGTAAWDFQYDREWIKDYRRKLKQIPSRKDSFSLSELWPRVVERNSRLIFDLKEGKISLKSNLFQGKLGLETKSRIELQKLDKIDKTTNRRWKRILTFLQKGKYRQQENSEHFRTFIEQKHRNTTEWKTFSSQ